MVGISSISGILKNTYKYGKQILKATPELTFGTSAETVGKAMRDAYKAGSSLSQTAKIGLSEINNAANNGNFLSRMWTNMKNLLPDLKTAMTTGANSGGNKILGAIKGLGKGIGKKLPFIFAAYMAISEIPNIVKATKEKGLFQGIKETIKPIVRLVGAGIGSAVGTAILPFGGSLVGWIAGEWLAGKLVGKSYTQEKTEKEGEQAMLAQQQQAVMQQATPAQTQAVNTLQYPQSYNTVPYLQNNQYANDMFMKQMNFNAVA